MERVLIREDIILVAEVNPSRREVVDDPFFMRVVRIDKKTILAEEVDSDGNPVRPPLPLPLAEVLKGRAGILDIRNQPEDREKYLNGEINHVGSFKAWLEQAHELPV